MNKKALTVISLVMFAAVLIFIFSMPVISKAPTTGTCCYQLEAYCVTPTGNIYNYYYLESGKCP